MRAWGAGDLARLLEGVAERYEALATRAYALRGTALTLLGLKASTLDVDLAFEGWGGVRAFASALRYSGLEELSGLEVSEDERAGLAVAESRRAGVRFDLYAGRVMAAAISPGMVERSVDYASLGWLELRVLSLEDVALLKLAAGREKDREDLVAALRVRRVDWDVVASELDWQAANSPRGEELLSKVSASLREWRDVPALHWIRGRLGLRDPSPDAEGR